MKELRHLNLNYMSIDIQLTGFKGTQLTSLWLQTTISFLGEVLRLPSVEFLVMRGKINPLIFSRIDSIFPQLRFLYAEVYENLHIILNSIIRLPKSSIEEIILYEVQTVNYSAIHDGVDKYFEHPIKSSSQLYLKHNFWVKMGTNGHWVFTNKSFWSPDIINRISEVLQELAFDF
jgi:hypothetical protein